MSLLDAAWGESACLSVLLEESGDELRDEVLLPPRELLGLLEDLLKAACGSWPSSLDGLEVVGAEDVLDAHAKDGGELGEDVGARGLVALLPEGDILLRLADGAGELALGEAGIAA